MAGKTKNISLVNTGGTFPEVTFGSVQYEPGGHFGPRVQGDYQLVIVLLGEACVAIDGSPHVIPPGSVALLSPGSTEQFRFSQDHLTHHTWCAVRPDIVPAPLRRRLAQLPVVLPQSRSFDLLMKAAFAITSWRRVEGRRMLGVLGIALLTEFVRMAKEGGDEKDSGSPHDRARRWLDEHFAEADALTGAARVSGVTPQHLIRLFRQHFGTTPGRYLWQARVERGSVLLTASGLTVAEVADRCGFKNPFHFSRLLRRMQGVSPRKLRQRAWSQGLR
jgi:AraC family transcriptional regulator of arabinose operon